ncbi:MAG: L-lactate permease [Alicyclobacillus macrosporangiidus]|uniref:L-lactate permease n=1 Tax=Alicyclobacillus macrosporangiidus TaxID=392015 RepID=UPI0026F2F086|nr:L-lactate permease [Alicyclobacillus macrosporangiidus]MCL6598997.1 L-lactate permease [Alicyclobacillus macrosporangiidus]
MWWDKLLAVSPVLVALVCLLGLRLSSARTAVAAYVLSVVVALAVPGFRDTAVGDAGAGAVAHAIGMATAKGLLLSFIVIYVLLFGLLLYNVLREAGALDALSRVMARSAGTPVHQALLISAALGPFLEATTGFGIGIVIAAPLLLALGFAPERAAVLALLTQSAVPWGALAVGTVLNAELSGVSLRTLGVGSAWMTVPLYLLYSVVIAGVSGGWRSVWRHTPAILLVWAVLSAATWAVNAHVAVPLAGVIAGGLAAGAFLMFLLVVGKPARSTVHETAAGTDTAGTEGGTGAALPLWRCLAPYGVLVGFSLAANLWPAFSHWLSIPLVLRAPSLQFELPLLTSPGFALFLASLAGMVLFRLTGRQAWGCVCRTLMQVWPVAVSTAGFVAMSTVMQRAGMIDGVSHALANWLGAGFVLVSPVLGGLGGFITGSNSAANAMFAPFQSTMAHALHQSPALYAVVQNVAASNLTMASPSRVALAASIAGLPGREGTLTRRMMALAVVVIGMVAVMAMAGSGVAARSLR